VHVASVVGTYYFIKIYLFVLLYEKLNYIIFIQCLVVTKAAHRIRRIMYTVSNLVLFLFTRKALMPNYIDSQWCTWPWDMVKKLKSSNISLLYVPIFIKIGERLVFFHIFK